MRKKPAELDRSHDVPYLAGYSQDGDTTYIDRHLPRQLPVAGRKISPDPFLRTHERVEKSLLDALDLKYQPAHRLAIRAEKAHVQASGIPWLDYQRALRPYVERAQERKPQSPPADLDLQPYRDERDGKQLTALRQ